ncbi:MAG TPA: hypothetical protein VF957_01480, partial [Bradyrhizobium sp.]
TAEPEQVPGIEPQAAAGRLAFHMSVTPGMFVHGMFETCRLTLSMSANRGRPEVTGALSKRRD